jgi:hypothetical protein
MAKEQESNRQRRENFANFIIYVLDYFLFSITFRWEFFEIASHEANGQQR